ncbi:hypothetical protein FRC11_000912, partial [Ceratobasidium sp. 423]
ISGCSPEVEDMLDYDYISEYDLRDASEPLKSGYKKIREALKLLVTEDEREGTGALSIIGPYDDENKPIWDFEGNPKYLDDVLEEAEGHVREVSGCQMGDMFSHGYCQGPTGNDDGAIVSYGGYFYVQTNMLAILAGATQGRVLPQRLWRLAMIRGHFKNHDYAVLPGVDYGPIYGCIEYSHECPWLLGDVDYEELLGMVSMGAAEDIAETLRKRGFWMWMRPDRFPIEPASTPQPTINITKAQLAESLSNGTISKLPLEIVQCIARELDVRDVIVLATLNKVLYYYLLGNQEARDSLARAYIHRHARWCLPYGESELKWWNERRGDDALGWDYLRRCWSESHSMRNRRRIWRAAESIEEECEWLEKEFGFEQL